MCLRLTATSLFYKNNNRKSVILLHLFFVEGNDFWSISCFVIEYWSCLCYFLCWIFLSPQQQNMQPSQCLTSRSDNDHRVSSLCVFSLKELVRRHLMTSTALQFLTSISSGRSAQRKQVCSACCSHPPWRWLTCRLVTPCVAPPHRCHSPWRSP